MIRDVNKEITIALNQLSHVNVISDEAMVAIAGIVTSEIRAWKSEVVAEMNKQIESWEETQGFEDDTLFTLGFRRARDLVIGKDSLDELPILEKPDTMIDEGEDG